LTRPAKTPEGVAVFNETKKTAEFVRRITQVKLDPSIKGFSDQVSGLFENGQWMFICSQHVSARFYNEEELREHFKNEAHKKSKFVKSQSTYD
jgi:predicted peroxiredoxin